MLITAEIDTAQGQDVSVMDTPRAFLTADMEKEAILILENKMVDVMLETDREIYGKYVIYRKNGRKHMYIFLRKAMYRTLNIELLYYRKVSKELREYGFVINPYNPCVANMWTSEGQFTVVWHVNDMKVSQNNK